MPAAVAGAAAANVRCVAYPFTVTIFTGSDLVEGFDALVLTFSALGFLISLFDFCWLLAMSTTFVGEEPRIPCHRMDDVLASIIRAAAN